MNQLEIEYKTLLSKSEYLRLQDFFLDVEPIEQINYYIDTPSFSLKKHRLSLRIRVFATTAELTLKSPLAVGNIEYNQAIPIEMAHQLLTDFTLPEGQIETILIEKQLPLDQLGIWGQLRTIRQEKETSVGLMALDQNHYGQEIDYELEVEVQDAEEGKIAFDYFLKKQSIKFKYASSKVARAASELLPKESAK